MPKPWKEISIDEILDFNGPQTAEIARYDRIMQHRTIEAMNGLSNRLEGVMETIHRAAQLGQDKANEAIGQVREAGKAQGKQQTAMIALTVALVLCTIAYTGIIGWSAYEMRRSNGIQATVAQAAREQAAAAREANAIQQQLMRAQESSRSAPSSGDADARQRTKR